MNASIRVLAICVLALCFPACLPFPLFQDVGSDPHPPTLTLLGVGVQVPTPVEGETPREQTFPLLDGFEVHPNDVSDNIFVVRLQFTDAGGDVVSVKLRDRDGALSLEATPVAPEIDLDGDGIPETLDAPEFLTGTSGIAEIRDVTFDVNQEGLHRLELWAEDSHGSRSEKIGFTVKVVLFR